MSLATSLGSLRVRLGRSLGRHESRCVCKPDSNGPRYQHAPFTSASEELRLLILHPALSLEAPLCGELLCGELHPRRESEVRNTYEALSYAWGAEDSEQFLYVDSRPLKIRCNLRDALRRLRFNDRPRTLWVDAICINQKDDHEKTVQVREMGRIYRSAYQVIVWLGEDSECKDGRAYMGAVRDAMVLAKEGPSIIKIRWFLFRLRGVRHDLFSTPDAHNDISQAQRWSARHRFYEKILIERCGKSLEELFPMFFERSWFSRRWVVQELLLSQRAVMKCGPEELDMDVYRALFATDSSLYLRSEWILQPTPDNVKYLMDSLSDLRKDRNTSRPNEERLQTSMLELLAMMIEFADLQCQDGRDRIAAFLGLWEPSLRSLAVDYSTTTEENYTMFAKSLMANGCFTDVLNLAGLLSSPTRYEREGVPSWVPEWRQDGALELSLYRRRTFWAWNQSENVQTIEHWHETDASGRAVLAVSFVSLGMFTKITEGTNGSEDTTDSGPILRRFAIADRLGAIERMIHLKPLEREHLVQSGDLVCVLGSDPKAALEMFRKEDGYYSVGADDDNSFHAYVLRECSATPEQPDSGNAKLYHLVGVYDTHWDVGVLYRLDPKSQLLRLV